MLNKIKKKFPTIVDILSFLVGRKKPIFIDYKVKPTPRYGYGKVPHEILYKIINNNRKIYEDNLKSFLEYKERFLKIPILSKNKKEANWINKYLPGLDAVAIYSFIARNKSKKYIEIGSGNSTKFAKKAILDNNLNTKIISIDPRPRTEIDSLCDVVIRKPIEKIELDIFDDLEEGDILFIDNSHRVFTNSDSTIFFLEILPRLKRGVLVEIHDIFLPYDYPSLFARRWYSEQYLLASYILAEGNKFDIILPNVFISWDSKLSNVLKSIWDDKIMQNVEGSGVSFWIKIN